MNPQMKRLYEAARVLKGITGQSSLARALNASPQTVKNWEARGVSKQGMLLAQRVLGCSALWVETGEGQMLVPEASATLSPLSNVIAYDPDDPLPEGFVQIATYNVHFSAGPGAISYEVVEEKEPATYRLDWLREQGIKPDKAMRFRVTGESMEPLLYDGDSVMVNTAENDRIQDGKVYAIRYEDSLRIKRLYRKLDGTLILRSDNPAYGDEQVAPEIADEHITIIGRVRDKSGSGGL